MLLSGRFDAPILGVIGIVCLEWPAVHIEMHNPRRPAFTLVEILVVVVILGILAAVVTVNFQDAVTDTRKTTFVANIRNFQEAALMFINKNGVYPEDSSSGDLPTGFDEFVDPNDWIGGTPLGGVWDFEYNSYGVRSAFGVHFDDGSNPGDAYMADVDRIIDNGDLASGAFQKIAADRYYYILEF